MSESAPRISDEAVEKLAKRLYKDAYGSQFPWREATEETRATWRKDAADHVTAILPLPCAGLEEELADKNEALTAALKLAEDQLGRSGMTLDRRKTFTLRGALRWLGDWASDEKQAREKAEQELEQVRGHVQSQRVEKVQAKQQLNQVREEVGRKAEGSFELYQKAVKAKDRDGQVVHGCFRDAFGEILAILDSSSSVSGGGVQPDLEHLIEVAMDAATGGAREGEEVGDEIDMEAAVKAVLAASADSALCGRCKGSGKRRGNLWGSTYLCPNCGGTGLSGDVEERGEEEGLALVQARVNELRRDALSSGDTRALSVINRIQEVLDTTGLRGDLYCSYCGRLDGRPHNADCPFAKDEASTQPNPEPHPSQLASTDDDATSEPETCLSGDGERLEFIARWLFKRFSWEPFRGKGWEKLAPEKQDAWRRTASEIPGLASRLSSEDSSGVEEGAVYEKPGGGLTLLGLYRSSLAWAIDALEEGGDEPAEDPEDNDWCEYVAAKDLLKDTPRLFDQSLALTQPDSTTRLSEGTGDELPDPHLTREDAEALLATRRGDAALIAAQDKLRAVLPAATQKPQDEEERCAHGVKRADECNFCESLKADQCGGSGEGK